MNVAEIQQRLKALGIYKSVIDGKHGPLTIAAIRGFQRVHGLKVDGLVGPKTLAELSPAAVPGPDLEPEARDLDPRPARWPRQRDVEKVFGPMGQNQTMLELPYPMRLAWDKNKPLKRFSIHEKVHDSALRCFNRIADAYDAAGRKLIGVDLFSGCLADPPRSMRGGTNPSMHNWAIAIDFDNERNQLRWGRDKARLALPDCERFWRIWEEEGWLSLGRARNFDWMHVQAARL